MRGREDKEKEQGRNRGDQIQDGAETGKAGTQEWCSDEVDKYGGGKKLQGKIEGYGTVHVNNNKLEQRDTVQIHQISYSALS